MTVRGMESYVVRVYRRDDSDPAKITGIVEVVQTGELEKFADRDELCGVICRRTKGRRSRPGGMTRCQHDETP